MVNTKTDKTYKALANIMLVELNHLNQMGFQFSIIIKN